MDSAAPLFDEDADVVAGVCARFKAGGLTDIRARNAIMAFITSLAPDDFLGDDDLTAFEVYVDISLQLYKRAPASDEVRDRLAVIKGIGAGSADDLKRVHAH